MISKSAGCLLVGAMTVGSILVFGQADNRPHFEVASVKPSEANSRVRVSFTPGKALLTHIRLKDIIPLAYGVQPFLISGGPAWLETEHYDIAGELAVRDGAPPERQQALEAVQVLLEERFKLRIHRETKELPLYKLTLAKGGFKPKAGEDLPEGTGGGFENRTASRFVPRKAPISSLVNVLSGRLGCHVEDQTGLQGVYSFVLEWQHDEPGGALPRADASDFALFAALRSQLGLNLERGKGPVEVLVIDSAEKPAAN